MAEPGETIVEGHDLGGTFDVIVDSNVVVQIYSCHDLSEIVVRVRDSGHDPAIHPEVVARLGRLHDALFFAIRCHEERTKTLSLLDEPLAVLLKKVPPGDLTSFERFFTTYVVHYMREKVLDGWQFGAWKPDQPVKGDAADDELLELALQNKLPLVTDEGNAPGGPFETKNGKPNLRGKAKARGVRVYTPGEWWQRWGFVKDDAGLAFAARANAGRADYVRNHPSPDKVGDWVQIVIGVYNVIVANSFD